MSYLLATTHSKVQWYKFNFNSSLKEGEFVLLKELDLHEVPCFGDKETAKLANANQLSNFMPSTAMKNAGKGCRKHPFFMESALLKP